MSQDTPVLSYKKRQKPSGPALNLPALGSDVSNSATSPSAPGTPVLGAATSRKVLSRRKALQEFYKIQDSEASLGEEPKDVSSQVEALDDPHKLNEFLRTAKAADILKVRNSAANKLNFHDLEKKSIIYDNYYELIKLNQVLSNLSADKDKKKSPMDEEREKPVTDEYVNSVLAELSAFLTNEASQFNQDFQKVVELICRETDSDSMSSVKGISARD